MISEPIDIVRAWEKRGRQGILTAAALSSLLVLVFCVEETELSGEIDTGGEIHIDRYAELVSQWLSP